MCVAVLVETEAGPTADELKAMDSENPHGAGVAFSRGNQVRYHKGVTWKWIAKNQASWPRPYLLHFRWATHGGRARHLAHPFPISISAVLSKRLSGDADAVLIHNGVWSDYKRFLPHWLRKEEDRWSDTAVAAYAAKVYGEDVLDDVAWSTAVGRARGIGRMDVTLRGNWVEHQGNMYSNLNWQQPTRFQYGGWDGWEDYHAWAYRERASEDVRRRFDAGPCNVCMFYHCQCEAITQRRVIPTHRPRHLVEVSPPAEVTQLEIPLTSLNTDVPDDYLDPDYAVSVQPKEKP